MVFSAGQRPEVAEVLQAYRNRPDGFVLLPDRIDITEIAVDVDGTTFTLTDKAEKETFRGLRLALPGKHQAVNAALAYLSARWYLTTAGKIFSEEKFRTALSAVYWPGRLQRIATAPDIIFDVSHNVAGFETSLDYAATHYPNHRRVLLLGLLSDKDFGRIVPMTGRVFDHIFLTEPASPRKMAADKLQAVFKAHGIETEAIPSPVSAFRRARNSLSENDVLFVMGSHFLIGELL